MTKTELTEVISNSPLFSYDQKIQLVDKLQGLDEDQSRLFQDEIENYMNKYDFLLNKIYSVTIKYKDLIREEWKKYFKELKEEVSATQVRSDDELAEEMLRSLDNL